MNHTNGWTRANALRIRCKAWSMYPIGVEMVHVTGDGRVHVWDACDSSFTLCHALSARTEKRIAKAYALKVNA